jgi:hypothetical protein
MDSRASESKPTEFVREYALSFSPIVRIAAATDSHAKRVRDERFIRDEVIM